MSKQKIVEKKKQKPTQVLGKMSQKLSEFSDALADIQGNLEDSIEPFSDIVDSFQDLMNETYLTNIEKELESALTDMTNVRDEFDTRIASL